MLPVVLLCAVLVLAITCMLVFDKYRAIKFLYDTTNDINNTMIKVSEELRSFHDINELYGQLLEDTINLIRGAEYGSILIYNKDRKVLEYKAAAGFDLQKLCKVVLRKEELYLYRTKRLLVPDIIKDPKSFDSKYVDKNTYKALRNTNSLGMKSCLSAPLYINGDFYGVINVDSVTNEDAFDKNDIRLIQYICRQLEIAITNALLMGELIDAFRIDKLTGIYNRAYFEEIMEDEIKKAEEGRNFFALVMIDMDNFKIINDTYGHKTGDEILKYFSSVLTGSINREDIAARFAGDEFIIVLHSLSLPEVIETMSEIRSFLADRPYNSINIEFSAGVCMYERGMDLDKIITRADNDMYREKRERKSIRKDKK